VVGVEDDGEVAWLLVFDDEGDAELAVGCGKK
jgi:hypothetical protein